MPGSRGQQRGPRRGARGRHRELPGASYYGDVVYRAGNDPIAALEQLVYDDYDPNDGVTTGMKAFNEAYPIDPTTIAEHASIVTAQRGVATNPAFWLLRQAGFDINGDGAAGAGDGAKADRDDDGLVGVNSQQQGYRLRYVERWGVDEVIVATDLGYVGDLNAPNAQQMTSLRYVPARQRARGRRNEEGPEGRLWALVVTPPRLELGPSRRRVCGRKRRKPRRTSRGFLGDPTGLPPCPEFPISFPCRRGMASKPLRPP